MTIFISTYFLSLSIMGLLDAGWLLLTIDRFYRPRIGHLLSDSPNLWAGAIFYLLYVLGLCVFVIWPALKNSSTFTHVFLFGALFGAVAYSTFDLTNQALLRGWPVIITIVDILWGSLITGLSSLLAYYLALLISRN